MADEMADKSCQKVPFLALSDLGLSRLFAAICGYLRLFAPWRFKPVAAANRDGSPALACVLTGLA
jgi:hypothetical protein